jgi:uncharacterized protein (TIGR03086 family)
MPQLSVPELHRRAIESFGHRLRPVRDDQWRNATPCEGWDVRQLVNHLVGEALWTPPLVAGQTIADVGDRFDGDVLGDDPKATWERAATAAAKAVEEDGAMERTVHLSFGDFPGEFYARQLFADYLVHSWDLARATEGDETLDADLVAACAGWFATQEDAYRQAGVIGPRVPMPDGADTQSRLMAMFGRQA